MQFKTRTSDTWKAPEAWDRVSAEPLPQSIDEMIIVFDDKGPETWTLDPATTWREVHRMLCANTDTMLHRLQEEWGQVTDAAIYKELELDKKRWMLAALYNVDRLMDEGIPGEASSKGSKVLALYENHGKRFCIQGHRYH